MANMQKQLLFFAVGMGLALGIGFFIDYRFFRKNAKFLYIAAVLILVAVLVFGQTVRGTTGWFQVGPFSIQPVEFVKILVILVLAKYFSDKAQYIKRLSFVFMSVLGVLVLMGIVLLQPDFGSAMMLFAIWGGFVLISGMKKSHIALLVMLFLAGIAVMWFFIFQPYQKQRVLVFLDPSLDPLGVGYNITQATIAIGSGQLFGKGLGFGSQSQLKFLPESQTDFIFAVIAEELGLTGVAMLLFLYGFLYARLIYAAKLTRDNFGAFIIMGVAFLFFAQVFVNIGMNLGLLPVTGLTLPFISYGGSSLLTNFMLIGLVESIVIRGR